jgi:hypothetical protein
MAGTITRNTKRKAKERPKDAQPTVPRTKGGRELVPLLHWVKKNPIKTDGWKHCVEDKRESQRKAKRSAAPRNQRREGVVPLLYKANWETSGIFFFLV